MSERLSIKTLPIYRIATPPQPGLNRIHDLAARFFGIENYSLHETNGRSFLRTTSQFIDGENGAIWAADLAELWNPAATPQLPDKQKARFYWPHNLSRSFYLSFS